MKNTALTFIFFILFIWTGKSQDCKSLREGKFKYTDKHGTTFITREGNIQSEVNKDMGYNIQLKINWINDCEYELRLHKVIENKNNFPNNPNMILKVVILETRRNSYIQETTSNVSDLRYKSEIFVIE